MDPAVSVVMPVRDGADLLPRAVGSVLAQTFPGWELLVTDDGSADATPELLAGYAAADPRVRVFTHPAARGVSAARNTAVRAARAEWVAYLDHDDEFYPGHLAAVDRWRGRGDVLVFAYDLAEERPGHPGFGAVRTYDPRAFYDQLLHRNIAVPLGVAHRRDLFDRAGLFDESLSLEEDADLWRRFAKTGATFTFVGERSGRYHVRADSLSRRALMPDGSRHRSK
jgi:glycosyltransferase involved in cell wall biosynthesis